MELEFTIGFTYILFYHQKIFFFYHQQVLYRGKSLFQFVITRSLGFDRVYKAIKIPCAISAYLTTSELVPLLGSISGFIFAPNSHLIQLIEIPVS